ncbi:MAG TPA: hypothetical protein DEF62_04865 [Porphyromonas gingivalis]|nr:hypothetical protein [Porphyromonas gingivalis]
MRAENRPDCEPKAERKWRGNFFVLVREFFHSRTKTKKFPNHVFGRGEPTILRTRCEQSVDDDL